MGKYSKFYNTIAWRKLSDYKLSLHPMCQVSGCSNPAVDAHHIIGLWKDYSKRLDLDNLMSLCKTCHSKFSQEEAKEQYKPKTFELLNRRWHI